MRLGENAPADGNEAGGPAADHYGVTLDQLAAFGHGVADDDLVLFFGVAHDDQVRKAACAAKEEVVYLVSL